MSNSYSDTLKENEHTLDSQSFYGQKQIEEECSIFDNIRQNDYPYIGLKEGLKDNSSTENFLEKFYSKIEKPFIIKNKPIFNIFIAKEEESSSQDSIPMLINNKTIRGRKAKNKIYKNKKCHDNNRTDNLLRKIQVHFISFIVSFINVIIKNLNYNEKFLKLDYNYKKNNKKDFVESLKKKTIREIICTNISDKYKHSSINTNTLLYEKIKNEKVIFNILEDNYLNLFRNIYYKSNKVINLNEYGLNKKIVLSNEVKMFKDLLKGINSNKIHQKKINESVKRNYLYKPIFTIN